MPVSATLAGVLSLLLGMSLGANVLLAMRWRAAAAHETTPTVADAGTMDTATDGDGHRARANVPPQ